MSDVFSGSGIIGEVIEVPRTVIPMLGLQNTVIFSVQTYEIDEVRTIFMMADHGLVFIYVHFSCYSSQQKGYKNSV